MYLLRLAYYGPSLCVQRYEMFDSANKYEYNPLMTNTTTRRKRFTVGLWLDATNGAGQPLGLQFWNVRAGVVKEPKLKWYTIVLAHDEEEALELGQNEYAGKHIRNSKVEAV